ncbi:MAG TPA: hypothetical protein DCL15_23490, partial [Chloroflexi bacterium]|nr:hypothetical protein [Chloroflexota bacterium]
MHQRHLICIVAGLFVVGIGAVWPMSLQAQTQAPPFAPVQPCPPAATWLQHLVTPGDRWATIAAHYGVSEAELRAANPTPLGLLRVGLPVQIPCVPGPAAAPYPTPRAMSTGLPPADGAPVADACTPPPGWSIRYTVLRGDTLSRLAAACHTSSAAIRQANGCRTSDMIYAGETLLLPCRPPALATATPARPQPAASPRAPEIPDTPPQPGPLRVALNPADAVVGAIIGVTIQDAGAYEPLAVTVACSGQTMTTFGVTASSQRVATATFSTAGFPAGRCRVDVARTVVSGGGSARLVLTPANAPPVQTLSPSSTTDSIATLTATPPATPAASVDAPSDATSTLAPSPEENTPAAPPFATLGAETTSDAPATSPPVSSPLPVSSPPRASLTATPTDVGPPMETPTATATLT